MRTVAACQCEVDDLDPAANFDRVERRLAELPARTDLVVFPEYGLTGFVADERVAERLERFASEWDVGILVGYLEGAGSDRYNAATYVAPDGTHATYRKRNRWGDEREWIEAGSDRVVVETPLGRTGLLTCYDLNFVGESAWFTEQRVDALLVVGAWPAPHGANWRLLSRARALDGVRWLVGANRTGRSHAGDRETVYAGRSLVVQPNGTVRGSLDVAPADLVVDIDPDELARHRETVGVFRDGWCRI